MSIKTPYDDRIADPHFKARPQMRDKADGYRQALADVAPLLRDILEDLEGRYDGLPDSPTLWMGDHIRRLRAALGEPNNA